MVAGVVTIMLV